MASPEHQEPSGRWILMLLKQQEPRAPELAVPAASRRKKVETSFFMKSRGWGEGEKGGERERRREVGRSAV